jgi:hypothetical protein
MSSPSSILALLLVFLALAACRAQAGLPCESRTTSAACEVSGSGCEWLGSYCEPTCSSLASASSCQLFDRCEWTLQKTCQNRVSTCSRWDDRRICESRPGCTWQDDLRACLPRPQLPGPTISDAESSGCAGILSASECDQASTCAWVQGKCTANVSPTPEISSSTPVDVTAAPSSPFRPCWNSASKGACEAQSTTAVTCVYSLGSCRPIANELAPEHLDPVAGSELLWAAVYSGAAIVVCCIMVWVWATTKAKSKVSNGFILLRFASSVLAIGLFASSGAPVVPTVSACLMCVLACSGLAKRASLHWLHALDFSIFALSFSAAAATSATGSILVLSAGVLLGMGALTYPIQHGLTDRIQPRSTKLDGRLVPAMRLLTITLSCLYVGLWSVLEGPIVANVQLVCMMLQVVTQSFFLLQGMAGGNLPTFFEALPVVTATLGSMASVYSADNHVGLALIAFACSGLCGFIMATVCLSETEIKMAGTSAFTSNPGDKKERPAISPSKHKVFVQPSPAIQSMAPTIAKSVSETPYYEPESYLGIIYFEQGSLNNSYNSQRGANGAEPRRRGSSADYKREMAIV